MLILNGMALFQNNKLYNFVSDMRHDFTPFSGAYGSVYAFIHQDQNNIEIVLPNKGKWLPPI